MKIVYRGERPARARDRPGAMPGTREGSFCKTTSLPWQTYGRSNRARILFLLLLISLLGLFVPETDAWPSALPAGVSVTSMVTGFGWVTDMAWITPRHVLVTTKDGRIFLLRDWQYNLNEIFINLRSRTQPAVGDRGLVSVVVHPDFQRNQRRGFIFVAYVDDPAPGCQALGQMCMIKVGGKCPDSSAFRMTNSSSYLL
jgi:hypothetical protein